MGYVLLTLIGVVLVTLACVTIYKYGYNKGYDKGFEEGLSLEE